MIYTIVFCLSIGITLASETREKRQLTLVCSDGSRAVSACFTGGTCGLGYRCDTTRNYCCTPGGIINQMPLCTDGTQAAAGCILGRCGAGYTCQGNTLCCRSGTVVVTTVAPGACPNNAANGGACTGGTGAGTGLCPVGFVCQANNICCAPTTTGTCPAGTTDTGVSCAGGTACPAGTCQNTRCCTTTIVTVAPTTCVPPNVNIGPCVPSTTGGPATCPAGTNCIQNQCCGPQQRIKFRRF